MHSPAGDEWKWSVDLTNDVTITDWGNAQAHVVREGGGTLHLNSLRTTQRAHQFSERLNGLVMLAFLALGCGAGRFTEVAKLALHQVVWRNGDLYFTLVSRKVGALGVRKGRPRLLKLPKIISRFVLLARVAFKALGCTTVGRKLLPDLPDQNRATCAAFIRLTKLPADASFGLILIRHFATTVCNLVFPAGIENFGRIVSTKEVSERSGHTERTATSHYSCVIEQRQTVLAQIYHARLGNETTVRTHLDF